MQVAFARAYREERVLRAEQMLLAPYGLDMGAFNNQAIDLFGDSGAALMRDRIERIDFDCEFLVCGFDQDNQPHIFTVSNPGVVNDYDTTAYWAIGSGAFNALGALTMRGHSQLCSLNGLVYDACEAKFVAENASGVGRGSVVIIQRPDLSALMLRHDEIEALRTIWEQCGKPRTPIGADTHVLKCLERQWPGGITAVGQPDGERGSSG